MVDKKQFSVSETFEAEGGKWEVGVLTVPGGDGSTRFAIAQPEGDAPPVLLKPTLLDASGKIEGFQLETYVQGRLSLLPPEALPGNVRDSLKRLANEENLLYPAADFSLPENGTPERNNNGDPQKLSERIPGAQVQDSHRIEVDGKRATLQVLHYSSGTVAGMILEDTLTGERSQYQLYVRDADANGKITEGILQKHMGYGQWRAAAGSDNGKYRLPDASSSGERPLEKEIPSRIYEEIGKFAERQKLFGTAQEKYQEKLDARVTDILSSSDIDREAAELFLQEAEDKVENALETGDRGAFVNAVEERKAQRHDTGLLKKPKDHFLRQAFEEKQANRIDLEHPSRVALLLEERQKAAEEKDNGGGFSR